MSEPRSTSAKERANSRLTAIETCEAQLAALDAQVNLYFNGEEISRRDLWN